MKTIVVPIDFSPNSLNAANYAVEMACFMKADLSLVHICLLPMTYGEMPYSLENTDSLVTDAEEKILRIKNDLSVKCGGKVNIITEIKMAFTVIGELANYCSSKKPYAVVMGTQGATALERTLFGSNTIMAIKHLAYPVIAVPPKAKFHAIKKIGMACDLKKVDANIPFSQLRSLITQFNAELYILHINAKGYTAEKTTETRAIQNMLYDLHPHYRFIDSDDIGIALEQFAEANKLDLLITVPKRHNIIDKIFHKSHTKKLVMQTRLPLMAVHLN